MLLAAVPGLEAQTAPGDTVPPSIAVTSPTDLYVADDTPAIAVSYSDDASGVDPGTLTILLDGADLTPACTVGAASAACGSPLLAEGGHTVAARVQDMAGNSAEASFNFTVDVTPPEIAVAVRGSRIFADGFESGDLSGWSPGAPANPYLAERRPEVVVTYSDALSGVDLATLVVEIDGIDLTAACDVGPATATCATPELADGAHTATASIDDRAGNSSAGAATVTVDATPPMIIASTDPPANAAGWHAGPVTVSFACEDALSGVVSCPDPVTVTGEGAGQEISGTTTDVAGNRATTAVTVSIDQTAPDFDPLDFRPIPCPAATSDLQAEVRACFTDLLSGVDAATVRLTVDGADRTGEAVIAGACISWPPASSFAPGEHQAEIAASDLAGNAGSAGWCFALASAQLAITIDSPANLFITNAATVDVSGTVDEFAEMVEVNGVAATIAGGTYQALGIPLMEGGNVITAVASNAFEGLGSASISVGLDTVPPVISAVVDPPASAAGWHASEVTVSFDCQDSLAGVASCTAPVTLSAEGAGQTAEGTAVDLAGNTSTATAVVNLDLTLPEIVATASPPPNAAGWNNSPVTVTFDCMDAPSGVASCPAPIVLDTEGTGLEVEGTVVDLAGNSATATVAFVGLDLTAPAIAATAEPPPNAAGWNAADVTVTFACGDALSGLTGCPSPVTVSAEGADQEIAGTAFDGAGNSATVSVTVALDKTPPTFDPAEFRPALCPAVTAGLQSSVRACFADALAGVEEATVALSVDGVDRTAGASIAAGCIAWDPPDSLFPGEHSASIAAADLAGNAAGDGWCFAVGAPTLALSIDSPAAGLLTRDAAVDVLGTVDASAETVEVNGLVATPAGGTFQALGVPLREGRNVITAVAATADGALGSVSRVVVRDTTAPVVRIETPRPGAVLTSLQVDVAGLVNDVVTGTTINADDCRVFVNGVEAAVANRSFVVSDLLLTRGANTLVAEARDRAGNVSTSSIEVTVADQGGQRIVLLAGNNQSADIFEELPGPLIVALEDAAGDPVPGRPVTFTVTRGDGTLRAFPEEGRTITVTSDAVGHASARFELGGRSGAGNYRVLARAVGFLGEVELCATAATGPPARITTVDGDRQRGTAGQALPEPLVVLVTDPGGNPVGGVGVTFEVVAGGGGFDGSPAVVETTDLDGLAEAVWTLGPGEGIGNHSVRVSFAGLAEEPATFSASAQRPGNPLDTRVSGVVLDNQDLPIPGVTLHLEVPGTVLDPPLTAVADGDGRFTIAGAPVGSLRLIADGGTAARPGTWPSLEFDLTSVAGRDNVLPPIWIPVLADNEVLIAAGGPDQDVTLLLPGVPGAELTVFAHSVTCPHGEPECLISWTQVRGERIPMAPPLGSSFMLASTFQPAGAHYDPPARLCIPNSGESPGAQVEIFSFDHDLGDFVAVGTATVSDDGDQICSDPGFGLVKGGWHGCAPPPPGCSGACNDCPPAPDVCQTVDKVDNGCGGCTCEIVNQPDGSDCDDMDACTVMDGCAGGSCTGEPLEVEIVSATAGGREEDLAVAFESPSTVDFAVEATDNGCDALAYAWDFGDGETSDEQNPSHDYAVEGEYAVTVTVTCDDGCDAPEETLTVWVVRPDLVLQGLPEEDQPMPHEENPGAFVSLNDDDDNKNGNPDLDDVPGAFPASVTGEDDLLPAMTLPIPDTVPRGQLELRVAAGAAKIAVWEQPTKGPRIELPRTWNLETEVVPDVVYVEGVETSVASRDVELELVYTGDDGSTDDDRAKLTVVDLELTVHKPPVIDPAEPEIADEDELEIGVQTFVNLDNDDGDADFDTGRDDNDVPGEDEMVRLDFELRPDDLAVGTVRLEAATGGDKVRVWRKADKGNLEYALGVGLPVPGFFTAADGALTLQMWVEGVAANTVQRETELWLTYTETPAAADDQVALTILGLDRIEWGGQNNSQFNDDTLDADPNHPAGLVPPAVRVFPGARLEGLLFPEVGPPRDEVDVTVTLNVEPLEPVDIFFKSFDIDDPTASNGPIDDESTAGDNRGTTPAQDGMIVGADGDGIYAQTFTGREATFEFQTTMQPGDNFRIAGAGDRDFVSGLANDDRLLGAGASDADGQRITDSAILFGPLADREIREAGKYASETLTVWRLLFVEIDSMGAVPDGENTIFGGAVDFLGTGTAMTELEVGGNLDDGSPNLDDMPPDNGRFESGSLLIGNGPGNVNVDPITGNGDSRIVMPPTSLAGIGFDARDNDPMSPATISGTVTEIIRDPGGTSFVWTLDVTASSDDPIDWPDFVGGAFNLVGSGEVAITAADGANQQLTTAAFAVGIRMVDDDTFYADIPDPDVGAMELRFGPAYILPVFDSGYDDPETELVVNTTVFGPLLNTNKAWDASDDFWWVVVLGAYQADAFFFDPTNNRMRGDNDPNREGTFRAHAIGGINGVIIYQEMTRDWIATPETDVNGNPIGGNGVDPAGPGRDTRAQEILNHEIGHLFNLEHPDGWVTATEPLGGLMNPSCCPPDNPATNTRGASHFTETSLAKMRGWLLPVF